MEIQSFLKARGVKEGEPNRTSQWSFFAKIVRTRPPFPSWVMKGAEPFSKSSYRRDLGQIRILGGNWYLWWG